MTPYLRIKYDEKSLGYFQKYWVGVLGTLTLFQTKISDFRYPISDLIKNLIPYLRPEALELTVTGARDKLLRQRTRLA